VNGLRQIPAGYWECQDCGHHNPGGLTWCSTVNCTGRKQATPATATEPETRTETRAGTEEATKARTNVCPGTSRKGPNRLETRYNAEMVLPADARYEALTLILSDGTRYTPDWVTHEGGAVVLHEVKGPHRFARAGIERYRRARDQWGHVFRFVLAKWDGKAWRVEE
jgi:hypothetical protein